MQGQQVPTDFTTETLSNRVVFLEAALAKKDAVISEKDVVISEKSADLVKLSAELAYLRNSNTSRLQRMIFGSKRERFISSDFPEQFKLEFEPKSVEIDQQR